MVFEPGNANERDWGGNETAFLNLGVFERDKYRHIAKSVFSLGGIARIRTGTFSHLAGFSTVSLIERYRRGHDLVIRDHDRRSSWENHRSGMVLDCGSIFELCQGWLDRNEFEKSDRGGSRVRIGMRIKSSISSRGVNLCGENLWMVEIQMSGSESRQENERKRNPSGKWDDYGLPQ
jgi:hypothetical protein